MRRSLVHTCQACLIVILTFVMAGYVHAQDGAIKEFAAFDTPNDDGTSVSLTWRASPLDSADAEYVIYGAKSADGPWVEAGRLVSTRGYKSDVPEYFGFTTDKDYHHFALNSIPEIAPEGIDGQLWFRVQMVSNGAVVASSPALPVEPRGNWFDTSKINVLIFVILFSVLIMVMINMARRRTDLFIRRIPGLDAVDEAIGRATEMGKPILYLNGLVDMSALSTIAATSILGRISHKVANYDSDIKVPCCDPIVMSVCQEVVKEAYLEEGRPDAYKPDNIYFITNEQFAYAAAVDGIIMRDRPAANFYMGYYFAESLLIAETGSATGAIQIAGTDSITQLPFFIATCDYTLMGEELYAASAYLSREPLQLGSLKGQDISKAIIIVILIFGAGLSTCGITFLAALFRTF